MNTTWPQPDWSDIQPSDDLITWLRRTCPDFTWNGDGSGENIIGYLTSEYEPAAPHFSPRLTQTEWRRIYGSLRSHAPIWPGLGSVELGEPVVLTVDAIVPGPMDGILLTVDALDPDGATWDVDTFSDVWRGGYVIFLSIDGHADVTQYIGPTDAVLVPKGMTTAGGVVVSLSKAAQVTVTPWSLGVTP